MPLVSYDMARTLKKSERVGSRITCNPPVMNTDEDFLVLVDSLTEFAAAAELDGWSIGPSGVDQMECMGKTWISVRRGDSNVIAVNSTHEFDKFMVATKLATAMNLMEKRQRCILFEYIRHGNMPNV